MDLTLKRYNFQDIKTQRLAKIGCCCWMLDYYPNLTVLRLSLTVIMMANQNVRIRPARWQVT